MSFIAKFKDATIGFSGYGRLGRDQAGGFGYVAILLLIVMAISATIATVQNSRTLSLISQELVNGPDFALRNGEVQFDGPMPYVVKDEMGRTTLIVDTTGQTTVEALQGAPTGAMLVTRDTFYQVQPTGAARPTDLTLFPMEITRDGVVNLLVNIPKLTPVLYLLMYFFQLACKALDAVVLGGIAMLYGSLAGRKLSFDLGFKLGAYAMSLPIIIQWIWPGFTAASRTGFPIWWGLAILYLIMGLRVYLNELERDASPFYTGDQ